MRVFKNALAGLLGAVIACTSILMVARWDANRSRSVTDGLPVVPSKGVAEVKLISEFDGVKVYRLTYRDLGPHELFVAVKGDQATVAK